MMIPASLKAKLLCENKDLKELEKIRSEEMLKLSNFKTSLNTKTSLNSTVNFEEDNDPKILVPYYEEELKIINLYIENKSK
jgi:hypothetical protein